LALGVFALVALWQVDARHAAAVAERTRDSIVAATPTVTPLIDKMDFTVPPGGYVYQQMDIPQHSRCILLGSTNARGSFGIETLVLPYDQMVAWQANPQTGNPVWRSGVANQTKIATDMPASGRYFVVVSNAQNPLGNGITAKIGLACTRIWPPSQGQ